MSSSPLPSALDAQTQTFPTLTPAQIARVRAAGKVRNVERGEVLFEPGQTNISFYVLLSGAMEIVQPGLEGEKAVATHAPGEFTGELNMISGRRSLVLGRITESGEIIELRPDEFRALISRDAELSDVFMRAFILRRLILIQKGLGNLVLLGSQHSAQTLRLREFLTRNSQPFVYMDLDADSEAQELLDRFHVRREEIPVVVCGGGRRAALRNPSIQHLAECLGLNASIDQTLIRDLVIVGAGPAGLAAAVYAASEGLDALVIETAAPGGQAGSSSKIENYLGFPMGISGQELAARAIAQASKFGAQMMVAHSVARLECDKRPYNVVLDTGTKIAARALVIATGAQYNKPGIENLERFEGLGVYYGATNMESQLCRGAEVIVLGGGNSAGQAAVFLADTVRKVHMVVRSGRLADTMSRYLIQRIEENPAIEVHYGTELVRLEGDKQLERVHWRDKATGRITVHEICHVFIMAGANPRTEWLRGCLALDPKGFILTGRDLDSANGSSPWKLKRVPQMLETSLPGVFAVGDVRSGNVKRVASAVGEGAISIHMVHRTLAEME
ncbi:MAG TPA: FAD-dependent oxidoreductase [Candidatus Acidoferrales bacterium]|nr:FAD-dependent oxidoreductase [Candidatus Acidoferrales bacterium]